MRKNSISIVQRAVMPNRRTRRRAYRGKRYGYNKLPATGPSVLQNGAGNAVAPLSTPNVINKGRVSQYNGEAPLHANSVSLTLTNNGAATLDLTLTAGRFQANTKYNTNLITDGTQTIAAANDLTVSTDFGVDGADSTWENFLDWVRQEGFAIVGTKIEWDVDAQKANKLRYERVDFFGDNRPDFLNPNVYDDPNQFHRNVIFTDVAYVMDAKTVMRYKLVGNCTTIFTFWIGGMYEKEMILHDLVRRQSVKSLY